MGQDGRPGQAGARGSWALESASGGSRYRSRQAPGPSTIFEARIKLSGGLQRAAYRKLAILDAANILADLQVPPRNRLEKLSGDRTGQYCIRINDPWRICFRWDRGDAFDVEIVDYHQGDGMSARKVPPVHPGEILLEEYLVPLGISQYRLAKEISVPARRINEIVHGKRAITADTALRLARFFGTTELFWINLQNRFDLENERDRLNGRLDREVSVYQSRR